MINQLSEDKNVIYKVQHSEFFHSQPPNYYSQYKTLYNEPAVSFHYVDEKKQKDRGRRPKSLVTYLKCGSCPGL